MTDGQAQILSLLILTFAVACCATGLGLMSAWAWMAIVSLVRRWSVRRYMRQQAQD